MAKCRISRLSAIFRRVHATIRVNFRCLLLYSRCIVLSEQIVTRSFQKKKKKNRQQLNRKNNRVVTACRFDRLRSNHSVSSCQKRRTNRVCGDRRSLDFVADASIAITLPRVVTLVICHSKLQPGLQNCGEHLPTRSDSESLHSDGTRYVLTYPLSK